MECVGRQEGVMVSPAVVPLRNALPGSPAFGRWIDLTIVLWVLVALVVSMLLYIAAWWRATSKT
jgi:Domain of unknown function (DUF4436)